MDYREAIKLLKDMEVPKEWKQVHDTNMNFEEKLLECLEERRKIEQVTNG